MRTQVFILMFIFHSVVLFGCADKELIPRLVRGDTAQRNTVRITDPEGPIPPPNLPPGMAAAGQLAASTAPQPRESGFTYIVETTVRDAPVRTVRHEFDGDVAASARAEEKQSTEILVTTFKNTSSIYRLQDTPPETVTGLEQRLGVSLGEARNILHSYGYYSGKVRGKVVKNPSGKEKADAQVQVVFRPGPQYHMGKTTVIAPLPQEGLEFSDKLPKTLADAGLDEGAPAVAEDVLAAVDKALSAFLDNGYPFAVVGPTRYVADHQAHTLEAEIQIIPGAFVRMGEIERHGAPGVMQSFIEAQRTWRKGRPWNQANVEAFRDSLRQSGLFQSIDLMPSEESVDGRRNVVTTLASAPERTVSGSLKYHSDFGPGIQGAWEHRNLTGHGDTLRVTLPLWLDMQELSATYRLPHFVERQQDFIAKASALNEDTDAYRLTSGAFSAGVERRLSRFWSASLQGSIEGGTIKEPDNPQRDYYMYGMPAGLSYDSTGSLLDAVKGQRLNLTIAPYSGEFNGDFGVVRSRLDGQTFIPLAGIDKVVLALRGTVGAVSGADSSNIPPSIRFYSGGGGSVRGYEYQSLGPRNEDDKPLGGGSLLEVSAETRWKLTPEWGVVAFVDGGTAYENVFSDPGRVMRWGAGLGVRYYTVIGPVRFDLATPLNPRSDDDPLQFYISIGQSF